MIATSESNFETIISFNRIEKGQLTKNGVVSFARNSCKNLCFPWKFKICGRPNHPSTSTMIEGSEENPNVDDRKKYSFFFFDQSWRFLALLRAVLAMVLSVNRVFEKLERANSIRNRVTRPAENHLCDVKKKIVRLLDYFTRGDMNCWIRQEL
jgi:hypothetical protein